MGFLGGVLGSALGTATVAIGVDTKQLKTGLVKARGEVEAATSASGKLGAAWASIGPAVTGAAAVGVVALGVASVRAATDFENSFTKIAALSNASADQIASWKDAVLSLAGETTVAPQELADALYFLASSGLAADKVMPTLEASAKAAAAGMGTTADVANLVSSAINAYGSDTLSAAHATDILTAAIKVGKAEPEEFASSLGILLPIAQKAGVSFDEVAASIAQLTTIGVPVEEAVTSVKGALLALEAPGKQAAETMASVGISTEEMRAAIEDQGVLGALQLLEDATGGNIDVMRKIIPNVRALVTQFGLTGPNLERASAGFDQVKNSTGEADSAFQKFIQGPGHDFQQLSTNLKVALIRVGEELLPIATAFARVASALVPLIPLLVKAALAFGAYRGFRFVATTLEAITAGFSGLSGAAVAGAASLSSVAAGIGTIAAANPAGLAAGVVELWEALSAPAAQREAQANFDAANAAFLKLHDNIAAIANDIPSGALGGLRFAIDGVTEGIHLTSDGTSALAQQTEYLNGVLKDSGSQLVLTQGDMAALAAGGSQADAVLQGIVGSFSAEATAAGAASGPITALAAAHDAAAQAARDQKAAEDALIDATLGIVSGLISLHDAQAEVNTLQKQGKKGTEEYKNAVLGVLQQQSSLNNLFTEYAAKQDAAGDSQRQIRAGLIDLGKQAGIAKGDVLALAHDALASLANEAGNARGQVDGLGRAMSGLKDKEVRLTFIEEHIQVGGKLD